MVQQSKTHNNTIQDAWKLITQAKHITLLTHFRPDGDGISACAAFEHFILSHTTQTPSIETIYPSIPPFAIKREPKKVVINTHTTIPDLLIAFDTANYDRLYYPDAFASIPLINIDHHVSNAIKGTVNIVSKNASSTCEMLFDLIEQWSPNSIDTYSAEALLVGILYDTNIFQTQSTYPSTLRTAAHLMEHGASLFEIKNELTAHKSPEIIKLWGHFLSTITIANNNKAAWASITQADLKQFGVDQTSLVGFSNFLSQLSEVDIIALFYENEDGSVKISLRSKKTDVNAIAQQFGGGGHRYAAGITSALPLDEIKQALATRFEAIS